MKMLTFGVLSKIILIFLALLAWAVLLGIFMLFMKVW
jgi:hypothetical protein